MKRLCFSLFFILSVAATTFFSLLASPMPKNMVDFDLQMSDLGLVSLDRCEALLKEFREGFKKASGLDNVLASCLQQTSHEGYAVVYFTEKDAVADGFSVVSSELQPFSATEESEIVEETYMKVVIVDGKVSREARTRTVNKTQYLIKSLVLNTLKECNDSLANVPENAWTRVSSSYPPTSVPPFAKTCLLGPEGKFVFNTSTFRDSTDNGGCSGCAPAPAPAP